MTSLPIPSAGMRPTRRGFSGVPRLPLSRVAYCRECRHSWRNIAANFFVALRDRDVKVCDFS
jgi:hypothetical protein